MGLNEYLQEIKHTITWDEVNTDELERLKPYGLVGVVLCLHGTGRSYNAAVNLTDNGFPMVCIDRAISGLLEMEKTAGLLLIAKLAQVDNRFAILTPGEQREFNKILTYMQQNVKLAVHGDCGSILEYMRSPKVSDFWRK